MIWEMEGDQYQVRLLTAGMFNRMRIHEQEHPLKTKYPVFLDRGFVVLEPSDNITRMVLLKIDGSKRVLLEHFNVDPMSEYNLLDDERLPFQPMLVPLDKKGNSIQMELMNAFHAGEVIASGYMNIGTHTTDNPYVTFTPDFHLTDDPIGLKPSQMCRWIFCDGYYIAAKQLAITTAGDIWDNLYVCSEENPL